MTNNKSNDLKCALGKCKSGFMAVGAFSMFINLLMLAPSLYMLQVYDRVIVSRSMDTLIMLTILIVFIFLVMGGLEVIRSMLLVRIGNNLDVLINERLYDAMFRKSLLTSGHQTAQPLDDLKNIRQFLSGNGLFAFFDAPWIPIYIIVLGLFNIWLGVFSVVAGLILLALAASNEYATRKPLANANSDHAKSQQIANSNLKNAEVLYAMGFLSGIRQRWRNYHYEYLLKQSQASDRAAVLSNISKASRMLFQSLILALGALLVIEGKLSPGMMIAGSILMGRALAPIDQMIGVWKGFVGVRSSNERLQRLLTEIPAEKERMPLPNPQGNLGIENIAAAPPGATAATIRGIDFSVAKGEHIGIVGPSASGKSTLARVLLGVWPTKVGKVRLDGVDIAQWSRNELGVHIGYLPQDIELFDGTISENIARFGEIDANKVVDAARRAGVHEMILKQSSGYDTIINSTGGVLSGGQRQRIGLARALYGNPKLIVLDEPNSNLDSRGEAALSQTLQLLKAEGTTLFVISHRTSILSNVDKLLVLMDGQTSMFGSREEVTNYLARKGQPSVASAKTPANLDAQNIAE